MEEGGEQSRQGEKWVGWKNMNSVLSKSMERLARESQERTWSQVSEILVAVERKEGPEA